MQRTKDSTAPLMLFNEEIVRERRSNTERLSRTPVENFLSMLYWPAVENAAMLDFCMPVTGASESIDVPCLKILILKSYLIEMQVLG